MLHENSGISGRANQWLLIGNIMQLAQATSCGEVPVAMHADIVLVCTLQPRCLILIGDASIHCIGRESQRIESVSDELNRRAVSMLLPAS